MAEYLAVVVYTRNELKLAQYRGLLSDLPVRLIGLGEVVGAGSFSVEDAEGIKATASRRATELCRATGLVALSEASGLEVDALGGRPGMRHRRFAHERATDAENNAALLNALEEVEDNERGARFRCVVALSSPWRSDVVSTEGRCEGSIARTPRGSGGFGYDPLFIVSEMEGRAMAELSEEERAHVSTRSRAVNALKPEIVRLLDALLDQTERIAG